MATLSQFGHPTMWVLVKGLRPPICPCIFRLWEITPLKTNSSPLEDGGFQVRNLQNSSGSPFSGAIAVSFQGGYSNLSPNFGLLLVMWMKNPETHWTKFGDF